MPEPSDWPGRLRRDVPRSSPTYAVRAPLAAWLREEASAAEARHGNGLRVLDVGCGVKPYFPFFARLGEYVGVDAVDNPAADVRASVESLPLPDGSFDLVLCLQVLEHVERPAQAVAELRRVTAPGGRVLASTHGVQPYHPAPLDLWRWTHEGLERLFHENGEWASITVVPASGSAACLGMLVSTYVDRLARRAHVAPLGRGAVAVINSAARALDGRAANLREPRPGTIFANYHVTAVAG
jgi:SAM-dependent methyltransferase